MQYLPPSPLGCWSTPLNFYPDFTFCSEEIGALHKNMWTITELPKGKNAIGSKWVFKTKQDAKVKVEWYEAVLLAKGLSQIYGSDYDQPFAPIVKYSTIRMLLSIVASRNMQTEYLDIKTAFLCGKIYLFIFKKIILFLKRRNYAWNSHQGLYIKRINSYPVHLKDTLYI